MIAFLIICIVIVLWVQEWVLDNATDFVDANFWPEENVVDPDDVFNIIVELKNKKACWKTNTPFITIILN